MDYWEIIRRSQLRLELRVSVDDKDSKKRLMRFLRDDERGHISSQLVASLLMRMQVCINSAEKQMLAEMFMGENIPERNAHIVTDLVSEELHYFDKQNLGVPSTWTITGTQSGSLIIGGAVVGVLSWVILNTIGETFKDAWKRTKMHRKLLDILAPESDGDESQEFAEKICAQIESEFFGNGVESNGIELRRTGVIDSGNGRKLIVVDIHHSVDTHSSLGQAISHDIRSLLRLDGESAQ